jgi:hypothetical protein
MASWKHCPPSDEITYERLRRMLVDGARDSDDGWSSLDYFGCVREAWGCVELPGLQIAKRQTNPERPLGGARWVFTVRHFINFPNDQWREDIAETDTFVEAEKAAEEYVRAHVGYGFTTRFRSEYLCCFEGEEQVVN